MAGRKKAELVKSVSPLATATVIARQEMVTIAVDWEEYEQNLQDFVTRVYKPVTPGKQRKLGLDFPNGPDDKMRISITEVDAPEVIDAKPETMN